MVNSISFNPASSVSIILDSTFPKIPLDLNLFTDLLCKILLKGSPSSTIKIFLMYSSAVILFPKILILLTKTFQG
jgi:hypothetical protein